VFRTTSELPATPELLNSMSDVSDFCRLLQTTKNGVDYTIFRRHEFEPTGTVDDSIITVCISTLESIERMREDTAYSFSDDTLPVVSSHFATDGVHDFVQIVARKNECSTSSFLCWAESGGLVTGTAIIRMRSKAFSFGPSPLLYENFPGIMRGTILPPHHLLAYAYDAGLARFSMVGVCTRQRLAPTSVESISKSHGCIKLFWLKLSELTDQT
jgi:hypothetical protein